MQRRFRQIIILGALFFSGAAAKDFHGREFIGFDSFEAFERDGNQLTSPVLRSQIEWDELVLSWNVRGETSLTFEAKVIYPDRETSWYCLGKWSANSGEQPRQSVNNQSDEDGRVVTDTLKLKRPGRAVQVRVTSSNEGNPTKDLKFLGLAFCDSNAPLESLPSKKSAWGKALEVAERSQADYPEGISEWCSPTSLSMVLKYWSTKLSRPELDYDVPDVARGVHDPNWPGTGNWPFNTAFAGAHEGVRAYVTRFNDISEIEDWISAGIPVIASVSYSLLKGLPEKGNGHLVVCIGFTEDGDLVVNDPGRKSVRQTYARENFVRAWAESENTVYLIHPEDSAVPKDRFGHWFTSALRKE